MKGQIVQVSGPVVDVEFEGSYLPAIKDALYVIQDGKKKTMEVSQHIGNNVVRCIMLAASEGLHRDMEVTAEGSGIKVPVGEKTLGRLFNVLGETIDDGEPIKDENNFITTSAVLSFPLSDITPGDVNFDGVVDLYDAIGIAKYLMDSSYFNEEQLIAGDYNKNGTVDLYDAIDIAKTLF